MRRDRHILLLTPNWRWDCTPLSVDTLQPPVSPPLEMAYISAGIVGDHRLIDAYSADLSLESLAIQLADDPPSKIVISTAASILYWRCPPFTVDAVKAAVAVSKEVCDAPIVLIGPHPTSSPDWVLDRTGADLCWRGGVERQFAAWLESPRESRYAHRPGGASDTCIEATRQIPAARMEVLPLRSPYPPHMWCVTDEERRLAAGYESGALVEASRGCPWACVYCAKAPVRDRFNRRPLEVLTEEWDELTRLGVEYFFFIDETFNIGGPHFEAQLEALASRTIRFGFQGRPELVTAKQATMLAEAGCVYAELGVDVGSSVLSGNLGRRQSVEEAIAGIEACRAEIPVVRYNRLNLSTLDYRRGLGFDDDQGWTFPPDPAYPYPGAPLGAMVMDLYGRTEFDWDFALRYSWWLRMEVAMQRTGEPPSDATLSKMQSNFLQLPEVRAREMAEQADGVQHLPRFEAANKYVRGGSA